MAGIIGSRKNSSQTPEYTKLALQTSALGLCIPIGWGRFRCGGNLTDYVDFKATSQKKKGKGGASGKGNGQKTYSASIQLALCEGPIGSIRKVYINQDITGMAALGLTTFEGFDTQSPWSYMVSHHPDHALTYADTAYVAGADYNLGSGATLPQHNFEVDGRLSNTTDAPNGDANPADIIEDFLTRPSYGLAFPSSLIDSASLDQYRTYCEAQGLWLSPFLSSQEQVTSILQRWAELTNTWIFWSGAAIKFVPLGDSQIDAHGVTYVPDCQPVYDLTYDDFIVGGPDDMPVRIERTDPADGYNRVVVHIADRSHEYNDSPIDWIDQASVDQFGVLQAQEVQADEVKDPSVGAVIAQLVALRTVYVRNTFKFTLAYGFVLLEPGDIVTITEPNIGLLRVFARITDIQETEDLLLEFTAEEFAFDCDIGGGTFAQSAAYAQGGSYTGLPNVGYADPGDINSPPLIFEPNYVLLADNPPALWIGASGGENWGGADVYISFDNVTFDQIGTINAKTPQGVLTAPLALASGLDTVNTLSVDLDESEEVLPSTVTHDDADAGRSLVMVDDELLAYGELTPGVTTYAADLDYLQRGLYGSTPAAHSALAAFFRVDLGSLLTFTLPAAYVGQTLYFKFASFNLFGMQHQDLSGLTTYTYTPNGAGFPPPSPTLLPLVNGDVPIGIIVDPSGVPVYVEV